MSAQLLHRASTKCVAGRNQHRETVLDKPVGDLQPQCEVTLSQKLRSTLIELMGGNWLTRCLIYYLLIFQYGGQKIKDEKLALARLVDFPTPFTPQKVMTKGLRWLCASITSLRMSTLRFGCRICTSESCRACFTVEATATTDVQSYDSDCQKQAEGSCLTSNLKMCDEIKKSLFSKKPGESKLGRSCCCPAVKAD